MHVIVVLMKKWTKKAIYRSALWRILALLCSIRGFFFVRYLINYGQYRLIKVNHSQLRSIKVKRYPSIGQSVGPWVRRSIGLSVRATYVIFPNIGLIKLSLVQIKSRWVNLSHFGCGFGIDEDTDKKKFFIDHGFDCTVKVEFLNSFIILSFFIHYFLNIV
jgi:hypothetical protein